MKLIILQPDNTIFNGEVESVTFPGKMGQFSLLNRHAPLISVLRKGTIKYRREKSDIFDYLKINGGFIKVRNNIITVCID